MIGVTDPVIGLILLFVAAGGFLLLMLLLATFLGPKHRTLTKSLPFECGSVSVGQAKNHRFDVRFYLVGVLFLLFDVEIAFLYPWSVSFLQLGWGGLMEMLGFMLVVGFGLVYVWRKGILDWNREPAGIQKP